MEMVKEEEEMERNKSWSKGKEELMEFRGM